MRTRGSRTFSRSFPSGASVCVLSGLFALTFAQSSLADEPFRPGEPHIFAEPGEVTDVIDAFDGDDPFDLHFTLGFQNTWKGANIRRETSAISSNFTTADTDVAHYTESTSVLNTRLDIGVYKDIAIYFRLPIILSNSQSLDNLNGSAGKQSTLLAGAPGDAPTQLFYLPFKAPNRSGVDYLAIGADLGITNQMRDPTKPTWVLGFEGRFSLGEPMHACNANPMSNPAAQAGGVSQTDCAYAGDINRDAQSTPNTLEGTFSGSRTAGVSRGTTGLEIHSYISRRIKYIEPYAGFRSIFEFQNQSSDFGQTDLQGSLVNHPPLEGWMILGLQVIPWENREQYQRFTIDVRESGAYRSEGREYSELFDALGSSQASTLRRPNASNWIANPDPATSMMSPSVVGGTPSVFFNGITDVQPYGKLKTSVSATWQAGEYVKFQLGGAFTVEQSHIITADQPCNPDFTGNAAASGPCHLVNQSATSTPPSVTGIPNPNYRPTIDEPGRRFKVEDISLWDVWLNGTVMF